MIYNKKPEPGTEQMKIRLIFLSCCLSIFILGCGHLLQNTAEHGNSSDKGAESSAPLLENPDQAAESSASLSSNPNQETVFSRTIDAQLSEIISHKIVA